VAKTCTMQIVRTMKTNTLLILVAVVLSACSNRANLTPDKAMLGQWQSLTTHYYIGPDKITRTDLASGNRTSYNYKIVVTNNTERNVTFKEFPSGQQFFICKFADDNRAFEQIIEIAGTFDKPLKFTYIDGKQEP
jgi:hypothetical protein